MDLLVCLFWRYNVQYSWWIWGVRNILNLVLHILQWNQSIFTKFFNPMYENGVLVKYTKGILHQGYVSKIRLIVHQASFRHNCIFRKDLKIYSFFDFTKFLQVEREQSLHSIQSIIICRIPVLDFTKFLQNKKKESEVSKHAFLDFTKFLWKKRGKKD